MTIKNNMFLNHKCLIFFLRDITDSIIIDKLKLKQTAMELKDKFIKSISHELRTITMYIYNSLECEEELVKSSIYL